MCLCGTYVQDRYFVSPDRYQYRLQLSTDSKFCMQKGTPISMPTTRTPFIGRLYFIYQSIGQIISFQMMPPLRSFDDLDGKERDQKKTDDLRAMTTLRPRTLVNIQNRATIGSKVKCYLVGVSLAGQNETHSLLRNHILWLFIRVYTGFL